MKQVPVWIGGTGSIVVMTVARNEGEALNNIIEKEPILAAIGCTAVPFENVDGCEVVALVPDKFEYGDTRRSKEEKIRKAAELKHEKEMKAEQDMETAKLEEAIKAIEVVESAPEVVELAPEEELEEAPVEDAEEVTEDTIIDDILG